MTKSSIFNARAFPGDENGGIVVLPRRVVRLLAAPMALLCGPVTMGAALVLEGAWLAANLPAHAGFFHDYAELDGLAKAGVLALVFVSILFHELCHAAVGMARGGDIGEVRLGTMACMPYCFTTIPGFSTMTRADRLAVLCGGSVGQMALAMIALALTPQEHYLYLAAETALLVALCNMLPLPGLDGHGILRELRGRAPAGAA
jgi:Zn-dependent protease